MANITRAALVAAATDLNKVLRLDPAIDVKLGVAQLRDQVVEAAMVMSADKDDLQKLVAPTREVIIALRDDVIAAVPRIRNALIEAMQKEGEDEEEIAREAGGSEEEKVAAVTFVLDELAELHAAEPPAESAKVTKMAKTAKPAKSKKQSAARSARPISKSNGSKRTASPVGGRSHYVIDPALVAAGKLPESPPKVTSPSNEKAVQPKFDALFGMAVAGNWDGIRNYKVPGSNAYAKYVKRYRVDLLAIHTAQNG